MGYRCLLNNCRVRQYNVFENTNQLGRVIKFLASISGLILYKLWDSTQLKKASTISATRDTKSYIQSNESKKITYEAVPSELENSIQFSNFNTYAYQREVHLLLCGANVPRTWDIKTNFRPLLKTLIHRISICFQPLKKLIVSKQKI